jgi:predicted O-methyltransferase YrrM
MPPELPPVRGATPWEVAQIQDLIRRQAGHVYLEIGSLRGGSLAHYGGAMPVGATVLGIDAGWASGPLRELRIVVESMHQAGYECHLFLGDSHESKLAREVTAYCGGLAPCLDVLFIDGDHTGPGCRRDLDLYVPLVRPGGLVLMHDCGLPGPLQPWHEKYVPTAATVHAVWLERSAHRRRFLIQEWCGYGGWWQ